MEAAAALGIAGNIVQFLDFGLKLTRTIFEIWNSSRGITKSSANTEIMVLAFLESLDCVSRDLLQYHGYLDQRNNQDCHMQAIVDGCRKLAEDLRIRIDKLRITGQPSKWKSIVAAVKSLWKEHELTDLENELRKLRQELETRVLFSLRTSMTAFETQQRNFSEVLLESRKQDQWDQLQSSITAVIQDTISESIRDLPSWPMVAPQRLERVPSGATQHVSVTNEFAVIDKSSHLIPTSIVKNKHTALSEPQQSLERDMAKLYAEMLVESEADIIKHLSFPVMYDREDAITPVEATTCEWIFEKPRCIDRSWDNFSEWLEGDTSLYWINGKAGSGKSTLMKHLMQHIKVKDGLRKWTGATKLLLASFFFWYSGYDLQKTHEGLLRGLLYSCLRNHRELIPLVVPEIADVSVTGHTSYWTMPRLRRAFQRLLTQENFDLKFCFFIDGLDEYAGSHSEIADFVKEIAAHPNTKVCVSSRPLAVFDPAFREVPRLILQNLTYDDIALYTDTKLTGNDLMSDLEKSEPGTKAALVASIVTKASGVFLWVRLVVQSLLDGLGNNDHANDLKRHLDDLPPDLEDLYRHMLDRITPKWYLEEGFRLLRIVQVSNGMIPLLRLCLAEQTADLYQERLMSKPSLEEQNLLCQRMKGRLKSRCLGMLETDWTSTMPAESQTVTFIHKSVYDFLETDVVKARIIAVPGHVEFQPEVAIMRAILLQIKLIETRLPEDESLPRNQFLDDIRPLVYDFLTFARMAEAKYRRAEIELVDELQDTVNTIWAEVRFRSEGEISKRIHWMGAPRNPNAARPRGEDRVETPSRHVTRRHSFDIRTSTGTETSDSSDTPVTRRENSPHAFIQWKVLLKVPQNQSINISSFSDVVRSAGLRHYMDVKQIPWSTAEAPEDFVDRKADMIAPAEILTRYDQHDLPWRLQLDLPRSLKLDLPWMLPAEQNSVRVSISSSSGSSLECPSLSLLTRSTSDLDLAVNWEHPTVGKPVSNGTAVGNDGSPVKNKTGTSELITTHDRNKAEKGIKGKSRLGLIARLQLSRGNIGFFQAWKGKIGKKII